MQKNLSLMIYHILHVNFGIKEHLNLYFFLPIVQLSENVLNQSKQKKR
ncbi:hypothetical protein THF5G08_50034 [Vibrio jasicida]|nr:hypothetical protein THF5G08_50034 [Vibrio jasicida]